MISQQAIDLILESEGVDQPGQWPGGSSGVTIGRGYDLGYERTFEDDWRALLPAEHFARIKNVCGLTGDRAASASRSLRDIHIATAAADEVFLQKTLPKYEAITLRAFPGLEKLDGNIRGALVSLVYNRGAGMEGDRRREMRAIHDLIVRYTAGAVGSGPLSVLVAAVAAQFRAMKRLWIGQGLDGLLTRRENEAKLVEAALQS